MMCGHTLEPTGSWLDGLEPPKSLLLLVKLGLTKAAYHNYPQRTFVAVILSLLIYRSKNYVIRVFFVLARPSVHFKTAQVILMSYQVKRYPPRHQNQAEPDKVQGSWPWY